MVLSDLSALQKKLLEKRISQVLNISLDPGLFQSESLIEKARQQQLIQGCSQLLRVAKANRIPLILHSSAAVFDGSNPKPYLEGDVCKAKNPLGKLAYILEKKVEKYEKHVILRTEGIFSPDRPKFFQKCIRICKEQKGKLRLLDQRCSPTPAEDVARVILAINKQLDCDAMNWGLFHYCALQAIHLHTFVDKFLVEASGYDKELASCLEELEISAEKSSKTQLDNSVLDCHHIMYSFGIKQRSREAAVKELIASMYQRK